MQTKEEHFDPEKLAIAVGYCRNQLDPFLKTKKNSSSAQQEIAKLANMLDGVLAEKQKKNDGLSPNDWKEIQDKLDYLYRKLIPLGRGNAVKKFESMLREVVLTIENHASYNHLSDKPIEKPVQRFHVFDAKHKRGVKGENDNKVIQEMIDNADSFAIVYISTEAYNKWGHVALKVGDQGYVHVNTLNGRPKFYTPEEWQYYLQNGGYGIMGIQNVEVPRMGDAKQKLSEFANARWYWNPRDNNCGHFAQQIVEAGGADCKKLKISFLPIYQLANVPVSELVPSQKNAGSVNKKSDSRTMELPPKKKFFSFKKDQAKKDESGKMQGFTFGRIANFFHKKIESNRNKQEISLPHLSRKPTK